MNLVSNDPINIMLSVFEDNNGTISVANAPKMTPRTKHIAVKYHFFKQNIGEEQSIIIKKIDTDLQIVNIFTKGVPHDKFDKLCLLLCGW